MTPPAVIVSDDSLVATDRLAASTSLATTDPTGRCASGTPCLRLVGSELDTIRLKQQSHVLQEYI